MSSANQDKLNGNVNGVVGKAKEIAGELTSNPNLKAEGQSQQLKGDVQKAAGSAKSVLKKVGDKIAHAAD